MINVVEMLENSAEKYPDKIAFADPVMEITYSELNVVSINVARYLINKNIMDVYGNDNSIVFLTQKSVKSVCIMFGAIYCNALYCYVDLRQGNSRVKYIIDKISPSLIITEEIVDEKLCESIMNYEHMSMTELFDGVKNMTASDRNEASEMLIRVRNNFYDKMPLYVNFTSGSTGNPKGVAVSHASVIGFIRQFAETVGISNDDIIANQAPFDFDVSVKDIYGGIYKGARIQLIPRDYFSNPSVLMDYLYEKKVTTLIWAVTALCFVSIMNGLEYRKPESINKVMFSGEIMPIKHLNKWRKYYPEAVFINLYGPTEITCNCTYHILDRYYNEDEIIPIGIPFRNERVFLIDEDNKEIKKAGLEGEICVSGSNLALGYYNDQEKTDAVFVENPLVVGRREIMYKTGDIGRYDEKGLLYYCTRKDNQIKHMGQRIELGDIEAAVLSVEGVELAASVYDHGNKKIILFYTGIVDKQILNKELRNKLPQYMIPGKTVLINEMPMNKNGKIDRKALSEYKL